MPRRTWRSCSDAVRLDQAGQGAQAGVPAVIGAERKFFKISSALCVQEEDPDVPYLSETVLQKKIRAVCAEIHGLWMAR